ncbi:MAG: phosphonate transport system substrate-binding protein [Paracoccaceae bacterium]|jgi:phosphonate transport system substrate-binding protein
MKLFKSGGQLISQTLKGCLGSAAIAATALTLSSCGDKDKEGDKEAVLRFSAIPDKTTTGQAERFKPVAEFLAKALDVKVEFVSAVDYGASVEKFENGDIQLAWFGGVSGVQARQAVDGAEALVAGVEDLAFKSYFIANAATGLEKSDAFPSAIAELNFTYGSSGSTSGCIMPSHFIMKNSGKLPLEFFKNKPGFSGAHDATALAVQDGNFQAGVLSYTTFDKMVAAKTIDPDKVKVIWETPAFADYNFTAHPELNKMFGEGFVAKLKKVLLECDDPAVLNALDRSKLVEVSNETFQSIADVMEKVKFD